MRRRMLGVALLLVGGLAAVAQPTLPPSGLRVTDTANMLRVETEAIISERLQAHEDSTTNQVVVVTLRDLGGRAIEPVANELFNAWGIGQAGQDNGVLLLIARDDRELRIEVGRGLEATLTDADAGRIIRNTIVPHFRDGDFEGGIRLGVVAILADLDRGEEPLLGHTSYLDDRTGLQRLRPDDWLGIGFAVLALLLALGLMRGYVVKTGGYESGSRLGSYIVRLAVGGAALGFVLYLSAYMLIEVTRTLGAWEWWEGFALGFPLWMLFTWLWELRVRQDPVWQRYRQMQRYVEKEKRKARKAGKKVTIHTWGGPITYNGKVATSSSSGSSWGGSSSFGSSSSSSFSGGGGSSGGGGASGSW